jgi:hypothetical protein
VARRSVPAWHIQANDNSPAVMVTVPALTHLASDSATVIAKAGDAGMLGDLARELGQIEKAHAASAADLPGKAAKWDRLAAVTPDPAEAEALRRRARDAREQLASDADHLNKATAYEAKAKRMTCAEDRSTYLALARAERAKAGNL